MWPELWVANAIQPGPKNEIEFLKSLCLFAPDRDDFRRTWLAVYAPKLKTLWTTASRSKSAYV